MIRSAWKGTIAWVVCSILAALGAVAGEPQSPEQSPDGQTQADIRPGEIMAAPTNSLITRDVPFLESPEWIVDAMLEMAEIGEGDVVYDLGSGDGRVVIEAAKRYGVRGVGIEIDDKLVEFSRAAAQQAGVADRVRFIESDIFEADFREASVVMIYLYEKVNEKLKPHLQQQLAPGTRVVCHKFGIKGWRPVKEEKLAGRKLFLYVIPPHG